MILKTIKKEQYKIEDEFTGEVQNYLEVNYFDDIQHITQNLPLEHKNGKAESIVLHFKDDSEKILILRTFEDVWVDNYKNVFLMNDEGKTIERIV